MKQLLSIFLCIVMMLSMVACGKNANTPSGGNHTQNGGSTAEPSNEEKAQIEKYAAAVSALNTYAADGYLPAYGDGENAVYDNEAFACYYNDILEANCIEKFVGTQYTADNTINWNRQEILSNIVVIGDVLLRQDRTMQDDLGNEKTSKYNYIYDTNEKLISVTTSNQGGAHRVLVLGWDIEQWFQASGKTCYIYDGNMVSKIQRWKGGEIVSLITSTYNEDGLKTKDIITSSFKSKEEYDYTYDSNKRLISVTSSGIGSSGYPYESEMYKCSYDVDGNLFEYTHNGVNGKISYNDDHSVCTIMESYQNGNFYSSTTVTFDKQGRILIWDEKRQDGYIYHYEQMYGDYYIYKPAEQE